MSNLDLPVPPGFTITTDACRAYMEAGDLFSFGTNDLTQTTCALSRHDAEGGFLTEYLEEDILEKNPFETID